MAIPPQSISNVPKDSLCRLLKKISEARRAKDRRAEAYLTGTLKRGDLSATKHMSLFQQPARI
jgi:predicted nucleotidyltransferase